MSDDKVRLGKVTVKMGDTEVSLTVEQARELCALLKGLFGDDNTKIIHTHEYVANVGVQRVLLGCGNDTTLTNAATSNVTFTLE